MADLNPEQPREFFSLKQIADTARSESWPTGRALEESRKLLRRKRRYRVTRNRQTIGRR